MAKLNIEVNQNGDAKYTLEFAGKTFDMTMVRKPWGTRSDKPTLDDQVEKELGDVLNSVLGEFDTEKILEIIYENLQPSSIELADGIVKLTEFEEQLKAEAMP